MTLRDAIAGYCTPVYTLALLPVDTIGTDLENLQTLHRTHSRFKSELPAGNLLGRMPPPYSLLFTIL